MRVITMSRNELTRLRVLIHVADGRLSVADATGPDRGWAKTGLSAARCIPRPAGRMD
jgi:hypothetical protein